MKKVNLTSITLRLSPYYIKEVKKYAEKENRSFNNMVNKILADFVAEEWEKIKRPKNK